MTLFSSHTSPTNLFPLTCSWLVYHKSYFRFYLSALFDFRLFQGGAEAPGIPLSSGSTWLLACSQLLLKTIITCSYISLAGWREIPSFFPEEFLQYQTPEKHYWTCLCWYTPIAWPQSNCFDILRHLKSVRHRNLSSQRGWNKVLHFILRWDLNQNKI